MKLQELLLHLKHERNHQEQLLARKRDEQRYLAVGNAEKILENAEELSRLADESKRMGEKRTLLLMQVAEELKLPQPVPTLKDILAALPPHNRVELEEVGGELRSTVHQLRNQNMANTFMLQRAMETLNNTLTGLTKPEETGVYTEQGTKKANTTPKRAGLNMRA